MNARQLAAKAARLEAIAGGSRDNFNRPMPNRRTMDGPAGWVAVWSQHEVEYTGPVQRVALYSRWFDVKARAARLRERAA